MKTKSSLLTLAALAGLLAATPSTHAQGSLTPPVGPPAPTMKTLDQIEPRYPISFIPTNLTRSGSYYLTTNLTGRTGEGGIQVSANSVTLDLNGFALIGVPGAASGIGVFGGTNVTICNGTVRNWPGNGVAGGIAVNSQIDRVRALNNGLYGIVVGDHCEVTRCVVLGNIDNGILANKACRITDCTVQGTYRGPSSGSSSGISARDGSIISGCVVTANQDVGIYTYPGCLVRDCTVSNNGDDGIDAGSQCLVINNAVSGNNTNSTFGAGIRPIGDGARIEGNNITGNHRFGVLDSQGGNVVVRNSARGNTSGNYSFAATTIRGPLITTTGTITNLNPWANFSF